MTDGFFLLKKRHSARYFRIGKRNYWNGKIPNGGRNAEHCGWPKGMRTQSFFKLCQRKEKD
jgi:hypothetical protein